MLPAANESVPDSWSFRCSACGKCCNSAPEMSLPELLHHQHRFVGSLAIRRVPRPRPGDRLGRGPLAPRASDADLRAVAELAGAVLHRLPGGPQADDVLLATQAFSHGASDPCPALGADMRCTIHDRKP
jgi:Fe-S-cluster containining protein